MDDIPTSPHCPHGDCSKPLHPFRVIITVWGFTKQTSGDYHNPFGESLSTNQYCIMKWQRVLNTAYVTCETYSSTHVCLEARWQESMGRQWRYLFFQSVGLTSLKNHVFFMLGPIGDHKDTNECSFCLVDKWTIVSPLAPRHSFHRQVQSTLWSK